MCGRTAVKETYLVISDVKEQRNEAQMSYHHPLPHHCIPVVDRLSLPLLLRTAPRGEAKRRPKDKVTSCQRQVRPFPRAVYCKPTQACSVRCSIGHPILSFRSGLGVVLLAHCRCRRCWADWLEERLTSPILAPGKVLCVVKSLRRLM